MSLLGLDSLEERTWNLCSFPDFIWLH